MTAIRSICALSCLPPSWKGLTALLNEVNRARLLRQSAPPSYACLREIPRLSHLYRPEVPNFWEFVEHPDIMLFSAGPELKIYFYFTMRTKKVTASGKYHNTYYGPGRTGKVCTKQCEEDAKLLKFYKVTEFLLGIGKIPT